MPGFVLTADNCLTAQSWLRWWNFSNPQPRPGRARTRISVRISSGPAAVSQKSRKNLPADAVIVGIVDSAVFGGKSLYEAQR